MKKAAETRMAILQRAYETTYRNGYQTTSIDDILAATKVTKGAFYYHFKNKDEMGIAMVKEVLRPRLLGHVARVFCLETDLAEALYLMVATLLSDNGFAEMECGCPLSNLIQEMTPHNAAFTEVLSELAGEWQSAVIAHIEAGKNEGRIAPAVQPRSVALFVVSSYWGIRNFGRMEAGGDAYRCYLTELKNYLNGLK